MGKDSVESERGSVTRSSAAWNFNLPINSPPPIVTLSVALYSTYRAESFSLNRTTPLAVCES